MNKFKFDPPQQQRKNNQHKSYDVALLISLEKCTRNLEKHLEIIRQDRLFLRNQIINGNNQIIEIFKKHSKSSQMQNLQIKLRKFIQNTKTRLKNEQLTKFKQALKMNTTMSEFKKQIDQSKSFSNTLKQLNKKNIKTQFNRSQSTRNVKSQSQQHYSSNPLASNQSLKHFQELLKFKYNQQVIEQRQSQNVTSARQGRQQTQQNRLKPLQQQLFDSIDNKKATRIGKKLLPNKSNQKMKRSFYFQKDKNSKQPIAKSPWQFQKKAKNVLYSNKSNQSQQIEQIQKSLCRKDKFFQNQSQEQSIYDKHFNQSNNNSISQQQVNQSLTQNKNINDFLLKESSFTNKDNKNQPRQSNETNKYYNQPKVIQNKQIYKQSIPSQNSRKSEQNLFTPQDLLAQCRNFLKNRDKSNTKPVFQLPILQVQQQCLFNRQNNLQNQIQKPKTTIPSKKQNVLPQDFSIQNLLECLMQITEMQPFIIVESLVKFINLHQNSEVLRLILLNELQKNNDSQICLTKIAAKVNNHYNKSLNKQYAHSDQYINSVYNLLDIDQKDFISQSDISSFLQQIESAEVQNYEQVNTQLWRLFNGADFANEHRITYWHFYLIKNSKQFGIVKKILDDFDFQIQRND